MTNEELLIVTKELIDTNTGGLVEPTDASDFIDLSVEQTAILDEIDVRMEIQRSENIDFLEIGEPVIRERQEGVDTSDPQGIGHQRRVLKPVEAAADFDVSFKWLRKNILGDIRRENWDRAMQKLNDLFAKRVGKDVVMTVFNGDTALAGADATEKALKILDGFTKQSLADVGVHDFAIPIDPIDRKSVV